VFDYQSLAKVKATSAEKLFDSLPSNDAVAEMCSDKFNVAHCRENVSENYQHHQHCD
jgi:hypothetical protein